MLHLFNKVYLASDASISVDFDRVVISNKHGVKMLEALDKVSYGELLYYGKTLDETLSDLSFEDFIQVLKTRVESTNKKVIIYADDEGFSTFAAHWFKAIFANITATEAWRILSFYIEKQSILQNSRTSSTTTNQKTFANVTEELFVEHFKNAAESSVQLGDQLSIEYLIANYLYDSSYEEELKKTLHKVLERTIKELVIEIKQSYVLNKYKSQYPQAAKDESFFMSSTLYKDSTLGQVSSLTDTIDIMNASEEDIAKYKLIAKDITQNWDQFKATSYAVKFIDYIDIVRKPALTKTDINTFINFEKTGVGTIRVFSISDQEKINVYFLDYILQDNEKDLSVFKLK